MIEQNNVDIASLSGKELIIALSAIFGPTGCEDRVSAAIKPELDKYCDNVLLDRMGNLVGKMSLGSSQNKKRLMLSAHLDEVGFMIERINDNGMLSFDTVGGIDESVIAGKSVLVGNEGTLINGVICSKAIHHKSKKERNSAEDIEHLSIDIGLSSKEDAEKYVSIGDFATFDAPQADSIFFGKDKSTIKCKALDDRMGCAAMLEIMDIFRADPPTSDIEVYFCFTVREEIGFSGAGTAAANIAPDLSIVLETTAIGDLPTTEACRRVADVGKGGVVSIVDRSTVYDRELVDRAMKIAKTREIPAQLKRYVSGGNDAGHIHKALEGVKALAISVPTRYLHSPACVASLDDYESVRDLAEAIMRDIYNS